MNLSASAGPAQAAAGEDTDVRAVAGGVVSALGDFAIESIFDSVAGYSCLFPPKQSPFDRNDEGVGVSILKALLEQQW